MTAPPPPVSDWTLPTVRSEWNVFVLRLMIARRLRLIDSLLLGGEGVAQGGAHGERPHRIADDGFALLRAQQQRLPDLHGEPLARGVATLLGSHLVDVTVERPLVAVGKSVSLARLRHPLA